MGAQALFTRALQERFDSPQGRAIWRQGIPTGSQWAYAIPLSILFGAAAGAQAVQAANRQLLGRVVDTPGGRARIVLITGDGRMVLQSVAAVRPPPPPPPSVITLVYDEAPGSVGRPGPRDRDRAGHARAADARHAATTGTGYRCGHPRPTPAAVGVAGASWDERTATTQAGAATAGRHDSPQPRAALHHCADDVCDGCACGRAAAGDRHDSPHRHPARACRGTPHCAHRGGPGEGGSSAVTRAWVREARVTVAAATAALRPLARSEARAATEAAEAVRARDAIARMEGELTRLDTRIAAELNPPGGFTREQILAGRRPWIRPRGESVQPSGREYHRLARERDRVLAELQSEVQSLGLTRQQQVAAATPGPEARPLALANAAQLDEPLRPVAGVPIDVTTGAPMTTPNWSTDHLMPRTEIAADRRYDLLTPAQRDGILLTVQENFLPMTLKANSSKGPRSVAGWIAYRAAAGRPIPPLVAFALRRADRLARKAVEAYFQQALGR